MDYTQQAIHNINGTPKGRCRLKFVDFETRENSISHETQGLSCNHLVVRRGKPFKVTLKSDSCLWNRCTERLVLEVCLGGLYSRFPVLFSEEQSNPQPGDWSATIYPGNMHPQSVTIHICSPVMSSVALYQLLVHIESKQHRISSILGTFVLLCNPWLKDDPVYMPLDVHKEEYIKSDYGLVYMGTTLNVSNRPWAFGQYEPGVLEACLKLLEVSPQHLSDRNKDYILRANPVYLSRVICAMVNCNDDLGVLEGKWQGSYEGGVKPTDWSSSADILLRWASSKYRPVRYGQCWVFASVLCTVMRILGIPSRVVTVFNAAHDGNANLKIKEFYTRTGDKLNMSKDSIWNFHVWVECWMRRPDLGVGCDGWQVVDPTPQKKSAGIFCCGPCPVAAIQEHCLAARYDAPFIYASVDADVTRFIVHNGLGVGRTVDTECVGQLIYTKSIGSDKPENLTLTYKAGKREKPSVSARTLQRPAQMMSLCSASRSSTLEDAAGIMSPGLKVTLKIEGVPKLGESIRMCVTITNQSRSPRVLMEHVSAQMKEYNSNPNETFWKTQGELHIQPSEVRTLHHTILYSEYESLLAGDDIVNLAVVLKDTRTKETLLAAEEFSIRPPQITVEIEGGDSIQMKKEHTALVSFTNSFSKVLSGVVLTVEGCGLLAGKREAELVFLQPGKKIEKKVSIMATSSGTKLLMATLSHSNSPNIISRCYHKVSDCFETTDWQIFGVAEASGDNVYLDECTSSVLGYIRMFMEEDDNKAALRAARKYLSMDIKKEKSTYALKIQGHFNTHDPQSTWKVISHQSNNCRGEENIWKRRSLMGSQGFLETVHTTSCLKTSAIISVPKTSSTSCLNDYHPVALTPVIIVLREVGDEELDVVEDSHQYAYRQNQSTANAIAALTHLEYKDSYMRLLFLNVSSAFNTIIPKKPVWTPAGSTGNLLILMQLDSRLPDVQVTEGQNQRQHILHHHPEHWLSTGLCAQRTAVHANDPQLQSLVVKLADDTVVAGLISHRDELVYRREVEDLTCWCKDNNLIISIQKTKEIVVDFCRTGAISPPLYIEETAV
ncbi:protein-glutamine gamma-glutamyltransferase 2 [Archocentrus centrarchus]|uniref:protein-glutamine gamma-glutamyltransferase 2 n=1 Tax=Archocentrus centrarchus TaxID=63155 RepID=UPI0011EA06BE|nr:protein-glutamine gamma-glutamyltransferase 2 [Archocentrus centrarchus]